jgi:hypothetical protein
MHPEPTRGLAADQFFDGGIDGVRKTFGAFLCGGHRRRGDDLPAGGAIVVDHHRDHRRVCAHGHECGDGCGGRQATKEGTPQAVVARMLIDEHAHLPAFADEFHRAVETFATVKKHKLQLLTTAEHEVVEKRIADGLVDGAGFVTANVGGGHLGE